MLLDARVLLRVALLVALVLLRKVLLAPIVVTVVLLVALVLLRAVVPNQEVLG